MSRHYQIDKSKYLLPLELQALHRTLAENFASDFRNVVMIRLLLQTGARASELLNITESDIYPDSHGIFLRGLKGSKDREIPIPEALFDNVRACIYTRTVRTRIFPLALRTLQGIWYQYRPCNKKIHSTRHTFAINLYRKTKDLRLVQLALGHRRMSSTLVYSEYVYETEEFKRLLVG